MKTQEQIEKMLKDLEAYERYQRSKYATEASTVLLVLLPTLETLRWVLEQRNVHPILNDPPPPQVLAAFEALANTEPKVT